MPDYIWEQLGKLLEMQMALIPFVIAFFVLIFVIFIISAVRFSKKHKQEIQEFEEHNKKIREQIEKQHFPDE